MGWFISPVLAWLSGVFKTFAVFFSYPAIRYIIMFLQFGLFLLLVVKLAEKNKMFIFSVFPCGWCSYKLSGFVDISSCDIGFSSCFMVFPELFRQYERKFKKDILFFSFLSFRLWCNVGFF